MENTLKKSKKKGFTLIELIIVLAVMAIIAAIAVPSYNSIKNNSAVKADKQTCETIVRTALIVKADNGITAGEYVINPANGKNTSDTDGVKNAAVRVAIKDATGDAKTAKALSDAIDKIEVPTEKGATGTFTLAISGDKIICSVDNAEAGTDAAN